MMKAMILAAGRGERLRPLTDTIPKPLIKVFGKPLIVHIIEKLAKIGVKEIVINISHLAEQFSKALGNGKNFNLDIIYSNEPDVLETGGGIFKALPILDNNPFMIISGDIYTDYPFENLFVYPKNNMLAHLVLAPNPEFKKQGDFSLDANGIITNTPLDYTYASFGVLHPQLFANAKPGKFSLAPLLRDAADKKLITGEIYRGKWHNIGTVEELEKLKTP